MSTTTLDRPIVQTTETDDPDEASHIVKVPPGEPDQTPQAYVMRARLEGFPITALCGYTWVPVRDPIPLPVCSTCRDVWENVGADLDERKGRLPDA